VHAGRVFPHPPPKIRHNFTDCSFLRHRSVTEDAIDYPTETSNQSPCVDLAQCCTPLSIALRLHNSRGGISSWNSITEAVLYASVDEV
jgi:hypothetical protein